MQNEIARLLAMDKMFLSLADVSPVLGSDQQTIRVTARQRPDLLGFPFTFMGNRMKIPRIPFLEFLGAYPRKEEPQCQTSNSTA